ncbi:serine hydrolase [Tropicimonas sp. S265A]|uniref:D-alanyl-D-alanine carboxypeptidase family protein n=1 Tax=Tropicimonas sp. S265A TaxID=3415134 RepID=UPI003C7CE665
MVMDARSGKVLHAENADTRLHPASLTKMMTLYIAFEAVRLGEITLDTKVRVSKKAAAEVPSKLGLKPGQRIALRYLIRASAVKSANDAATAIGEAISGSEAAFARRMNRTAKALGMTRTTFKNAHGLTEAGHLSTARDMTVLGRRLFYDYPQYYNLFSRQATNTTMGTVRNTNRRLLNAYRGADGIKTGYTRAAGFNLVASAERGQERIIATVFGGRSTATRNARVAELLNLGFRKAPTRVAVRKPALPNYANVPAARTVRTQLAVTRSPRPVPRPGGQQPAATLLASIAPSVETAIAQTAAELQLAQQEAAKYDIANVLVREAEESPGRPAPRPNRTVEPVAEPDTVEVAQADTTEQTELPNIVNSDVAADSSGTLQRGPAPDAQTEDRRNAAAVATGAVASPRPADAPAPRRFATVTDAVTEIVSRASTSGGRHWGINVGAYPTQYQAERALLKIALKEIGTLDEALRKVSRSGGQFQANFVGLNQDTATLACRRLTAQNIPCEPLSPPS